MSSNRLLQLLEMQESDPADTFVLFALAKEYEGLEDDSEALHYYQQLLEKDPQYVGAFYHLAKLYERQEALLEAVSTYEKGIAVAKAVSDQHALAELQSAKLNLELEL
ncbi:MAG: tetratricopeptide repeat protein [Haliscomenobacter sp.]|uniref:tetratricopeptide repeat protein n=1 Tax=Haliscomenobacter sp. TaxID=2717303 RepID=UPI0029B3C68C|nr:tetratricopeptide repeat protein [Haliscomenobacter sp.]MDX2067026.1 tetratricopeptide repeat protein [Haliscomenobacter sp.]